MVPIHQPMRQIKEDWVRGVVSSEELKNMNRNPYAVMMICEAKRIATQQKKEYERLIQQNKMQNER